MKGYISSYRQPTDMKQTGEAITVSAKIVPNFHPSPTTYLCETKESLGTLNLGVFPMETVYRLLNWAKNTVCRGWEFLQVKGQDTSALPIGSTSPFPTTCQLSISNFIDTALKRLDPGEPMDWTNWLSHFNSLGFFKGTPLFPWTRKSIIPYASITIYNHLPLPKIQR